MLNFIEELKWRGMLQDATPGVQELLDSKKVIGYIGFDPTAPSMTIGNYVQIMLLKLFQLSGHTLIVLMGGATGRIGDPSGKDKERDANESSLKELSESELATIAEEIPSPTLQTSDLENGIGLMDLLAHTQILSSKNEVRKAIQGNAVSFNKVKVTDIDTIVNKADLLHGQYIMIENGKKNKYLLRCE